MRRISDDSLIEIANLNLDFAPGVSDRTKITHMAITANPNLRPLGKRAAFHSFEPLIVANRIAPYVSMRGSGHFALADVFQARSAPARTSDTLFVFHDYFYPMPCQQSAFMGVPQRFQERTPWRRKGITRPPKAVIGISLNLGCRLRFPKRPTSHGDRLRIGHPRR
jgi:hypothetical protein